jgi:hypothetical protein
MELLRIFITEYNIEPSRLTVSGYGEYHPVDTNDTAEGRGHNRRVDIVILSVPNIPPMEAKTEAKPLITQTEPVNPKTQGQETISK